MTAGKKCECTGQCFDLAGHPGCVDTARVHDDALGLDLCLTCAEKIAKRRSDRQGAGWMVTASGRRFFPRLPDPADVCIEDVAHALSNICRFGGHVRSFYSVAQHSVIVSKMVPERLALYGLLHDAPEAYIGDMVRPLKRTIPEFQKVEAAVWSCILKAFELPDMSMADWEVVKHFDNVAIVTERRDLLPPIGNYRWAEDESAVAADAVVIIPASPGRACFAFLERFAELRRAA